MARVKGAMMTRKRRNKILKAAKGYWGAKSKHFKMAKQAVMKSGNYAFAGRKMKKRDFRSLWITRISAEAKMNGDGRVLVRMSGTEPLIRVMLEGSDYALIEKLANEIAQVIKERLS